MTSDGFWTLASHTYLCLHIYIYMYVCMCLRKYVCIIRQVSKLKQWSRTASYDASGSPRIQLLQIAFLSTNFENHMPETRNSITLL